MRSFEDVFAEEISGLRIATSSIPTEQAHLERCMELAGEVVWSGSNAGNEIGRLLGDRGVALFDRVANRLAAALASEEAEELRGPSQFLAWIMRVHDIGKCDLKTLRYDGSGHEERSGDYVLAKAGRLADELGWSEENAALLVHLSRFHSHLGIARLGEVSNVFLEPVLLELLRMDTRRKRLFLDFLVVMTCCDAGASGNFDTGTFYLDESRIVFYTEIADELFDIAETFAGSDAKSASLALLENAACFERTVVRIRRMVTAENRLHTRSSEVSRALEAVIERSLLDLQSFALTQFDHGAYVFAPLLALLADEAGGLDRTALEKFLIFLGQLCAKDGSRKTVQFRRSFSMKADLQAANGERFRSLCAAVKSGSPEKMRVVIERTE
ncbi:hypothetical protein IEN85_04785 [Pelagicoccus sp. NFK12]|uniref:Uncharacterized protein n=1 Tax=Pelagicoccus enzymogenes TaxID=2773457 RepID=A0A927F6W5_9BACT|nr:hypothetical protein [Pelagicoccus enzymogenes]MBD5778796.1 hypothetical protein [Pelagicoccus enzymogenes]